MPVHQRDRPGFSQPLSMTLALRAGDRAALAEVIRQSELAGAPREAALLHTDRLPPFLSRPHHVRLARQAMSSLVLADRAQCFELSRSRLAVVWRGEDDAALGAARDALHVLISGQAGGNVPALADLLTVYRLPDHALAFLDDVAEPAGVTGSASGRAPLDLDLLGRLETGLAQADLAQFVRSRPVMWLPSPDQLLREPGGTLVTAWQERGFALPALTASLCPEHRLRDDPWLFRRLTRTLDSRVLAMLTSRNERDVADQVALNLNVATLLGPDFVRFDNTLPLALRGRLIIILRATDILADPAAFVFARNFVRARRHRLALAGVTPGLLRFINVGAADMDFVQVALTPELRERPGSVSDLVSSRVDLVVTGLDRPSDLRWAVEHGFRLGRGRVFSQ